MPDPLATLQQEIARFRAWANTYSTDEQSGEWECNYHGWSDLYHAFVPYVESTSCQDWSDDTVQILLYAIARDNDNQYLAKELAKNPNNLICIAERAGSSAERDAIWQLVVELGALPETYWHRVEPLILDFMHSSDAYVKRRALDVLADHRSKHTARYIAPMWDSNDEYQRVNVLYALWKTESSELAHYLALANADGQPYLKGYAARILRGDPV